MCACICMFENFKPGARRPSAPGFLKLISCRPWYACVCVSAPQAIKNYSREMKSEQVDELPSKNQALCTCAFCVTCIVLLCVNLLYSLCKLNHC